MNGIWGVISIAAGIAWLTFVLEQVKEAPAGVHSLGNMDFDGLELSGIWV